MRDGVAFPAIRVRPIEGLPGRYRIVNGTHRAVSRLAGLTYVELATGLKCPPSVARP